VEKEGGRMDSQDNHERVAHMGDVPSEKDILDFIATNRLDDRAAQDLQECSPELQARVLARGDLTDARNPSAMLLSRIKESRGDIEKSSYKNSAREDRLDNGSYGHRHAGTEAPPSRDEIERFLEASGIDRSASDDLLGCDPEVQAKVLAQGDVKRARNPSAALMQRIREAKKSTRKSGNNRRPQPHGSRRRSRSRSRSPVRTYPERSAMRDGAEVDINDASGGNSVLPHEGQLPVLHFLDLPSDSALIQDGLPPTGFAVIHDAGLPDVFRNGHFILRDLAGDLQAIEFHDDPDWQRYPDVAQALGQVGIESHYCVAVSPSNGLWGVGIGPDAQTRESSSKLALCLSLAPGSDKFDSMLFMYPDFASLCAEAEAAKEM
jgi:hypothetical protein